MRLGPFTVTPFAVDHGIDDAFALLVEADGCRLLYSGDLRGHGREPGCLEALARRAAPVDVPLFEGTRIAGDEPEAAGTSEADVEEMCVECFGAARGAVIVFASAQNLDRVDTIVRAADRIGRAVVLDLYGATVWSATRRPWPCGARVRLAAWQCRRIIESRAFERTRAVRSRRIFDDELARRASELVILTRTSSLEELENLGVLLEADAIWSMWSGYLSLG